jgi:hypothetical protein
VKTLQVQIRLQNVQILQTLNAEALHMQKKMHAQVQRIMSMPAFEKAAAMFKPKPFVSPVDTAVVSSVNGNTDNGDSSEDADKQPHKAVNTTSSHIQELYSHRDAVLTLLADLIDHSCTQVGW